MSFIFWGLTTAMIVAAIATVVTPIRVTNAATNKTTAAIAVVVSLFAIGLYSALGSPEAVTAENDHVRDSRTNPASDSTSKSSTSVGSVASMVERLRDRLDKEPDDADGWILLARSYQHLGRDRDASVAYERARALGKTDPKLEKAFESDGDVTSQSAESSQVAIRGRVSLDQAAYPIVQDTDTVFIFAKASNEQRMPIIAVRKSAADLPIDFVLTDKQAMVPGTSLADFDELFVTARISRSGLANDAVAGLAIEGKSVSPSAGGFIELTVSPSGMIDNDAEVPAE